MEVEGDKGTVCVTGGTGFVGSWLIMRLLDHGYSVNTTIRPDPEQKRDLSFLTSLPGASKKLQIFHADLSKPESYEAAIKGCIGVFHVATPIDFENKEPEEVIARRTIDGTLGILKACLSSKTVRRVVYTSSASTVEHNGSSPDVVDETSWSDVDYIRSMKSFASSYMLSKTLTEKKVIEFAIEHGLDLVTLIPPFIVGPFICPKLPGSIRTSLAMVFGEWDQDYALFNMSMVHTDDMARAHIFLFENPSANGRYICSFKTATMGEICKTVTAKYSEFPMPTVQTRETVKGFKPPKPPGLSSKKLLDSGFVFRYGIEEMFDAAIQCCREKRCL